MRDRRLPIVGPLNPVCASSIPPSNQRVPQAMSDSPPTMLANRLRKRRKHLRKWAKRHNIRCYRLYDRDIPEIPLAIDWYDGRLHVAEYHRDHDRTDEAHAAWLDGLMAAVAEVLEVDPGLCFLKRRQRQRGTSQYERLEGSASIFIVQEWDARFEVNLSDYLDTGLFLDHRNTRRRVASEAAGKDLLNLFAYTGSFSVHAALGGAASTTSVDLSNTYCAWAERNFQLNNMSPRNHRVVREDVMTWLRQCRSSYDVVVCDPPTFSNSKRTLTHLDIQRDQFGLLTALAEVTRPGGVVYFSTNFKRFKPCFDPVTERFRGVWSVEEVSAQTVPEDFRNKRVHRCWRLVRERQSTTG